MSDLNYKSFGEIQFLGKEEGEPEGTFIAYASTFGNVDLADEIVMPGAFRDSIRRRAQVPMLWQHQWSDPIGKMTDMVEDKKGLRVKGTFSMGVQRGREAYEMLKDGTLDSLSIGYREVEVTPIRRRGRVFRQLQKLDLREISVVTFPANPKARVGAVKTGCDIIADRLKSLADLASLNDQLMRV